MSQDIARARELGRQEAERIRAELGTEVEFLGHPDYCSAYHRMRAERDRALIAVDTINSQIRAEGERVRELERQLSSARDWAVNLEQANAAVIDLHSRENGGQVRYCSVDGELVPCSTVRAARGER